MRLNLQKTRADRAPAALFHEKGRDAVPSRRGGQGSWRFRGRVRKQTCGPLVGAIPSPNPDLAVTAEPSDDTGQDSAPLEGRKSLDQKN